MTNCIKNFLISCGILSPKSTASVLASFQQAVDDLYEVSSAAEARCNVIKTQVSNLELEAESLSEEVDHSNNVRGRLLELLS
jgi:hypothetical protein